MDTTRCPAKKERPDPHARVEAINAPKEYGAISGGGTEILWDISGGLNLWLVSAIGPIDVWTEHFARHTTAGHTLDGWAVLSRNATTAQPVTDYLWRASDGVCQSLLTTENYRGNTQRFLSVATLGIRNFVGHSARLHNACSCVNGVCIHALFIASTIAE